MYIKLTNAERLKDLRVERHLTLEQLAEQTGISKSALGSYEANDDIELSPFSVTALARFYGVSTDYLLGMTETEKHPNTELHELGLSDGMNLNCNQYLLERAQIMGKAKLILNNFDARISNIEIKPKNRNTRVIISSKMFDEVSDEQISVKIVLSGVAAISFDINYFDNCIGSEAAGLYRIDEKRFIEELIKRNFARRLEIYLLEDDYEYDENDPNDMLNTMDIDQSFMKEMSQYTTFIQNVDAGTYIFVARDIQIMR